MTTPTDRAKILIASAIGMLADSLREETPNAFYFGRALSTLANAVTEMEQDDKRAIIPIMERQDEAIRYNHDRHVNATEGNPAPIGTPIAYRLQFVPIDAPETPPAAATDAE